MKQLLFFLGFFFSVLSGSAQEFKWDVNAGYILANTHFKIDLSRIDSSEFDPDIRNVYLEDTNSESGFFIGLGGQLRFAEKIAVTGHINYASYAESSYLQIPVLLNYYLGDSGLNVQAGPQFTYVLEDLGTFEDDINKLNIGAGAGLGYDFTENLFLEARYIFQLNDYYKIDNAPKLKTNYLNVGLGYRF